MASPTHVVFMNYASTGHMNPTLPVVAELVARGCKVTYFVEEVMRDVVEAVGADWRPFRAEGSGRTGLLHGLDEAGMRELVPEGVTLEETGKLLGVQVYDAREVLPGLLEDLHALSPQPAAIVYDSFVAAAGVAAHVLRVPSVGFVPHPGPGVCAGMSDAIERLESQPWVDVPRQDILRRYGVDLLEKGMPMHFYSPSLNIVTTIEDFFVPAATELQKRRIGHCPTSCIGSVADPKVKRVANANVRSAESKLESVELPLGEVDEALAAGKKLVFVSLGTVATGGDLWPKNLGHYAAGNDDGREEGARGLAEFTGKEFCQYVWKAVFEALGGCDDIVVMMSLGGEPDALEGMPATPQNFIVRKAVPQLEVLRRCSVFLTHGGANSMHEALASGVPLAVVPIFGDQPTNADSVARVGAGVSFRHPLRTLTAEALRTSVLGMLEADSWQRAGARAMQEKLAVAGGAPAACKAILDLVSQSQGRRGGA